MGLEMAAPDTRSTANYQAETNTMTVVYSPWLTLEEIQAVRSFLYAIPATQLNISTEIILFLEKSMKGWI